MRNFLVICFIFTNMTTLEGNLNVRECIEKVLDAYEVTDVLYVFEQECFIGKLQTNYTLSVVRVDEDLDFVRTLPGFDFYIFSISQINKLEYFLSLLQLTREYKSGTPVLAYIANLSLNNAVQVFRNYNLVNLLLLTADLTLYTYYPIGRLAKPVHLFKCSSFSPNGAVYNESKARYFENCDVRILAQPVPPFVFPNGYEENKGIEIKLLRNILKWLKVKPVYVKHNFTDWGVMLPNGTATEIFGELQKKRADIAVGYIKFTTKFSNIASPIFSHFYFYAPLALQVEAWENIFQVFDVQVWCTTLLVMLALPIFWFLCTNMRLCNSYLLVTRLLLAPVQFTPADFKSNILYCTWIIPSFLLVSFYQSVLISVIFKPSYHGQVSTLDQMVKSSYHYGGGPRLRSFFKDNDNPIWQKIYKNYYSCNYSMHSCMVEALSNKNLCVLLPQQVAAFYLEQEKGALYRINSEIHTRIAMSVQNGYPLAARMEELIRRMADAGLVTKWDVYGKMRRLKDFGSKKPIAMTIGHLKSTFGLLVVGSCVSVVAFAIELLWFELFRPK